MLFSLYTENMPNIIEDDERRQALSRTGIPACPGLEKEIGGKKWTDWKVCPT